MKPKLQFWFEFASTYSYLSAMRIDAVAEGAGVDVVWMPFLLGPVFAKQGLKTSPFLVIPDKYSYMEADIKRLAEERGLQFSIPPNFPQNGLHAARLALIGLEKDWGRDFCRKTYLAQFDEGQDIADKAVLNTVLASCAEDPEAAFAASVTDENKQRLKDRSREVDRLKIFGAPTFITEKGTLFWGDDRLEQAISYALRDA
ncbi:MAG: 2-hydroxychromene-2-carboxylate isomerase [Pseudomonadota bacterium]